MNPQDPFSMPRLNKLRDRILEGDLDAIESFQRELRVQLNQLDLLNDDPELREVVREVLEEQLQDAKSLPPEEFRSKLGLAEASLRPANEPFGSNPLTAFQEPEEVESGFASDDRRNARHTTTSPIIEQKSDGIGTGLGCLAALIGLVAAAGGLLIVLFS